MFPDGSRCCLYQLVARFTGDACGRIVIEGQLHHRVTVDWLKLDLALIFVTGDGSPGDHLIRLFLDDLRLPATLRARHLGPPLEMLVIELPDLFDVAHELGEILELGPLLVDLIDWFFDFYRLFRMRHTGLHLQARCALP